MPDDPLDSALKEAFGELAALPGDPSASGTDQALEKYELLRELGEGGMGEVVLAFDRALKRKVALKSIRSKHRLNEQARARFVREARILAELEHPNICRIHDYVVGAERDFLVLEFVDGVTLGEAIARGPSFQERLAIARAIASVLAAAHAAGVVHRDLKPANVMVTADGEVKVLDFGISSSGGAEREAPADLSGGDTPLDELEGYHTELGALVGTPQYMSPEQASGAQVTAASDQYAFGLLLQELFTGSPARPGGRGVFEQVEAARRGEVAPLSDVDREVAQLVRDLLALEPGERPSAERTLRRLDRIRTRLARRLRFAAAAAILLAAAGGATKYVVDLQAANSEISEANVDLMAANEEIIKKNVALEEQQAEILAKNEQITERIAVAEGLLEVFSEFRGPLEEAGRLDLLAEHAAAIEAYFDSLDAETLSITERARQIEMLCDIGQIRAARGDLEGAARAFDSSWRLATDELTTNPENEQVLSALGLAEYFLGITFRDQGDRARARAHMERYGEISETLARRDPANAAYGVEVAYSLYNLATLHLDEGEPQLALPLLDEVMEHWQTFRDRYSEAARAEADFGPDAVQLEIADVHSLRGDAEMASLEWDAARSSYELELETYESLLDRDPRNALLQLRVIQAENHVALARYARGELAEALTHAGAAVERADALVEQDPANSAWLREASINHTLVGQIALALGEDDEARVQWTWAERDLRKLVDLDTTNADLRLHLYQVVLLQAQEDVRRGALHDARERLDDLRALATSPESGEEQEGNDDREDPQTIALEADLLEAQGDATGATERRRAALAALESGAGSSVFRTSLELSLRLDLGELDEAAALWAPLKASGYRDPSLLRALRDAGVE